MITQIEPPEQEALLEDSSPLGVPVTFLPDEVSKKGGLYRGELAEAVKTLGADGVRAQFFHPPEQRQWLELYGPAEISITVAIAINLLAAAGWDGIKLAFSHWLDLIAQGNKLKINIAIERGQDATREWYRLEGRPEEVLKAFGQLIHRFEEKE